MALKHSIQAYSITTQDGITINNIPDDVAPNDERLKARVAAIRKQREENGTGNINDVAPDQLGATGDKRGVDEFFDKTRGVEEAVLSVASSILAEPVAGVAGIAQSLNIFAEEGAGARAVEATRKALTFRPENEDAQENLRAFADFVKPAADFFTDLESSAGDAVFDATGSPFLAAIAKTAPTAVLEALGIGLAKGATKTRVALREARGAREVAKNITEAAPSIDQLQSASRAVYKEIDDLNVKVDSNAYGALVADIKRTAQKAGLDPDITPKAEKALRRFEERVGTELTVTELDTLRKVAKNASNTLDKADEAIALQMVNAVDDFMDSKAIRFNAPEGIDVSKRYKAARDLWGRSRRSEMLEEAFFKARLQASGFENGVRVQFRQILNNKAKRRFFKPNEIAELRKVIEGTPGQNFLKLLGRFGFNEGGATNIIGGSIGVGAGAMLGGAAGAIAIPLIGQVSRKLAAKLTEKNASFANDIIKAGADAQQITKAYIKNTPKKSRTPEELSELLISGDIDLSVLKPTPLNKQAAVIARRRRAENAALATGSLAPNESR